MKIFKEAKHQPIKFRNFKFIGFHEDYPNTCYYYKECPRGNYELLECILEGEKKPEIGAGTNVKVLDPFMARFLANKASFKETQKEIVCGAIERNFGNLSEKDKKEMIDKFSAEVPKEIKSSPLYRKYKGAGYDILYCSNDENENRLFGIVNIVLVKEEHIESNNINFKFKRDYVLFKPLRFSVSPKYLKNETPKKYIETELNEIRIDKQLLK